MFAILLFVIVASFFPQALAQEIDHTQDTILGYSPILIALGITISGVTLRIFQGLVKRRQMGDGSGNVDPLQIVSSFVISFFASLPIVGTALHNIPYQISDLNLFVMLVGMVATVMGIDAGVKAGMQQMKKKTPVPAAVVVSPSPSPRRTSESEAYRTAPVPVPVPAVDGTDGSDIDDVPPPIPIHRSDQ